jgi:hypothetical protein
MVSIICPKCKNKIDHVLAFTKRDVRVFAYNGNKFSYKKMPFDFSDMNFVCPKCENIISRNKQGIDYYFKKYYIKKEVIEK